MSADWQPLRDQLASAPDGMTISWDELDRLVGGLPRSAYEYAAFWSGDRRQWVGFRTQDVRVGTSVTFVPAPAHERPANSRHRVATSERLPQQSDQTPPAGGPAHHPDVVLVGCVKTKLDHPAPARELYVSPLFRGRRRYAESTGAPWFILSAEHGLVAPDSVLAPYDLNLAATSARYRRHWGTSVVNALQQQLGSLTGLTIEIHAGSAYVNALRLTLRQTGAHLVEPVKGLTIGGHLRHYQSLAAAPTAARNPTDTATIIEALLDQANAISPDELIPTKTLGVPGLYSWWVDGVGATHLSDGLGEQVEPGLIYAGLAGATRSRSGRKSANTLYGRLATMHLGRKRSFSTFRLSLAAILSAQSSEVISETELTEWMTAHLRVRPLPVADADRLDELETTVLTAIDPPLNLAKMPKSPVRERLSMLRKAIRD